MSGRAALSIEMPKVGAAPGRQNAKQKATAKAVAFCFGAGYGNRTRLLGLGSRCTTDVLTLRFVNSAIIADFFWKCKTNFAEPVIL